MNLNISVDWKFIVALGITAVGTIFAVKLDASAVERVSVHAIDAYTETAVARNSSC